MPSPDRVANGDAGKPGPSCMVVLIVMVAALAVIGSIVGATLAHAAEPPRLAGHRGATGVPGYSEQSLKAVGYAKTYGAEIAEGDVRFTADDYAVMAHNDQAPGCTGTISGRTFADLRTCSGSSVLPQLLFWLREVKRLGMVANVELKGHPTEHQLEVFRRTVVAEAPADTVVASFYPDVLDAVDEVLGERVRVAPIIAPTGSPFGYSVAEHAAKYDLIMPDYRWMIVARMHWYAEAGVEVWLWTASTDESITRCKALAGAEPATSVIIADDVRKITDPAGALAAARKAKR